MVKRIRRKLDVKMETENAMKKLGWNAYPSDTNALGPKDCIVKWTNYTWDLISQESYWGIPELCIKFNVENTNELPYIIAEILENVTHDVEESGADDCTAFKFTRSVIGELGEVTSVELYADIEYEVDWVDNGN